MPIFDEEGSYNGTDFKLTHYVGTKEYKDLKMQAAGVEVIDIMGQSDDFDEVFEKLRTRSIEIQRQTRFGFSEFKDTRRRPEDVLRDYGRNSFTFEYWAANYITGPEYGKVVEAETETGEQALELIEHLLFSSGRYPVQIPISAVQFMINEAWSGDRRCANLVTQAVHPPSLNDMCNIYVSEIGGD